jgi:exo-1,4-beta-D-glucosaminidase
MADRVRVSPIARAVAPLAVWAAIVGPPPCAAATSTAATARIVLDRGWALQSSRKVAEGGERISSPSFHATGWYRTSVPSTVVAAQVAAGEFPDPYFGMNLRQLPGMTYPIGLNSFNNVPMDETSPYACSWWYRTEFPLPAGWAGKTVWLRFQGINYRANVWLNGRKIADAGNVAGAYRIHELDVSAAVLPKGTNVLAVETFAPTPKDLAINWVDWNPTPPDKNMGLWGEVSLSASGPVSVRHPQVVTHLPDASGQRADLTIMAELGNASGKAVQGVLEARMDGIRLHQDVTLPAGETRSVRFAPERFPELKVGQPRLWWPAEMGTPSLHELTVAFSVAGAVSDERTVRVGLREVTSALTPHGARLFRVNGKPILVRGGAWAQDMLLRPRSRERREAELQYVLGMNLNTLRFEGQLETDEFYDMTDAKGILVMAGWCCCDVWEKWDEWPPANLEVARESLRTQILRLRRHPSMLTWLDGSDGPPPPAVERVYLQVLEESAWPNPVVSSASAASTSVTGPSGVQMTGPYDYEPPSYWLAAVPKEGAPAPALDSARYGGGFGFNTETGPGPAFPPLQSLRQMLPPEHLWPIDEVWRYHGAGERFQKLEPFTRAMNATYGPPSGLEEFLRKAQAMIYDSERALFEAYGRNKYASTGVIHWMLNNAWPSTYWHLYDWYLYPAAGYFAARKAGEPLHVQYSYDDRSVVVVSTRRERANGLTARAQVYDFDLRELLSREATVDVDADSSTRVLTLPPLPSEPPATVYFLRLCLRDPAGRELSSNFYWLPARLSTIAWDEAEDTAWAPVATFEDMTALNRLPKVRLEAAARYERDAAEDRVRVTLRNPSPNLAFQVHVGVRRAGESEEVLPVLWEDNYLALMPGESRALTARYLEKGALGERPTLVVDGWNVGPLAVPIEIARVVTPPRPR